MRHGLNKDLDFTDADRIENIRHVGEIAKLMTDAGLIVITAFIAPFWSERQMERDMMAPGEFIEVFVDPPLSVAEERDFKGTLWSAQEFQRDRQPIRGHINVIDPHRQNADQIVKYLIKE